SAPVRVLPAPRPPMTSQTDQASPSLADAGGHWSPRALKLQEASSVSSSRGPSCAKNSFASARPSGLARHSFKSARKLVAQRFEVSWRAFVITSFHGAGDRAVRRIERFEAPQFGERFHETCEKPRIAFDVLWLPGGERFLNGREFA